MQLTKQNMQMGFSMVELAVVMAIISVVSLIAFPSLKDMIGNSQIRSTAESFRNGLQLARAEAVKRNQVINFVLNADNSWRVGCQTVTADCPATIVEKPPKEGSSSNIVVTKVGGTTAQFTTFGTKAAVAGQLSQIDIDNPTLSGTEVKKLRLVLGVGGNVKMCEPAITTIGDSRKCP
jgi:type IV fimbrial biogenesis protein FimT